MLGSEKPRHGRSWKSAASNLLRRRGDKNDAAIAATTTVTLIGGGEALPPYILTEQNAYECLGYGFSRPKKWLIITAVFLVQLSMNFNAAVYANAIPGLTEEFGLSTSESHLPQALFLMMYAFGCELWAPWSEELGRWKILQISLLLVNIWQLPCALAPSFSSMIAGRILGGLSSAGGSVTLGMVADMWEPNDQQFAINYIVLSSCAGSVLAPIFGGFITEHLGWPWVFWTALIFGVATQFIHFFTPETRSDCRLDNEAKRRRKAARGIPNHPDANVMGPTEARGSLWERMTIKNIAIIMWRPYLFLLTEPIVTWLSLLSGFSDALTFTALDSFGMILKQWDFTIVPTGLAFIPLLLSYLIGYLAFMPRYYLDRKIMRSGQPYKPERRLYLLLWLVPLETIGLFMFAWCSLGPDSNVHWIAPLLCTIPIGIANLAIYLASIDYMVAAYGPYSASATGGNGFARDMLAGFAALYARPFYKNIATGTKYQLVTPSLILSGIAFVLAIPVYIFYAKGEWVRKRSKFAQSLASERENLREERIRSVRASAAATPVVSRRESLEMKDLSDVSSEVELTKEGMGEATVTRTWDSEELTLANTRSTGIKTDV